MSKKNTISADWLITEYMNYVLKNDGKPKSVYAFTQDINTDEAKFYEYFGSFEGLEKSIFNTFFKNTLQLLEKDSNYTSFSPREKLLSFYFTFFEVLTANRSYVSYTLKDYKTNLQRLKIFSELKSSFNEFINSLEIETIETKHKDIDSFQKKALNESAWIQLLITIEFWLQDASAKFEKTDIFIEKSVNTSFEILNISPLKSIIDLGKFLYNEKIQMQ
ncbi:TetR family transcriptional regulator C-terminal domain-containing protein [Aestuariibaculum sediminum]|uniref:TetR/AcrR family transcriptional regulator n=1 Tax=Aestuariibaculum sediminum TaxID=2770637 RepID=A0A8J6PZL9_9FLAO|nr:TetR family transcriptional regulator C-terminal domain-containing protein [Aestuariibaculum sediminum]MBD0831682.1 TetR/AcrR family transcriptional regulator [Aestuariibaculum sediminum]